MAQFTKVASTAERRFSWVLSPGFRSAVCHTW
jgi:hypothetical protein